MKRIITLRAHCHPRRKPSRSAKRKIKCRRSRLRPVYRGVEDPNAPP
jgi:hypothetical protein